MSDITNTSTTDTGVASSSPIGKVVDLFLGRAKRAFEGSGRSAAWIAAAGSIAAGSLVSALGYLLLHNLRHAYFAVQFAVTNERLRAHLEGEGGNGPVNATLEQARQAQGRGIIFMLLWGLIGASLFYVFWRRCWHVGPAVKPAVQKLIPMVPLAGAGFGILEKLVTLVALSGAQEEIELRESFGVVITTLAWAKWVLAGVTILAVAGMVVSALTGAAQRGLRPEEPFAATVMAPKVGGLGVSCSGGGIRAASFSLGALSALEHWPAQGPKRPVAKLHESMLGSANYLSSVSGGGYAASAWRIAAGTDRSLFSRMPPLIGDPNDLGIKPVAEPRNLLEHVRKHRSFLANGRGGLPLAVIRYVLQTMLHMGLMLGFVFLLMWPLGRLISGWPVAGVEPTGVVGNLDFKFGEHQWVPPLVWLGAAIIPWLARLATKPGPTRNIIDAAIAFFAFLCVGSSFVLIALPWLTANINLFPNGDTSGQFALTGIYATVVTAAWQVAKRYLSRQAKYLGGLLLAAGVGLFGLLAVEESALRSGWLGHGATYLVVVSIVIAAFIFANPDKWSLSDFYRQRLAGTFVTHTDPKTFKPTPLDEDHAPGLFDYINAPGPQPIVCCAAARRSETETGVAALSMTFEPQQVTVHSWRPDEPEKGYEPLKKYMSHVDYKSRLPRGKQGDRLASLIGAAAISGAAVAPSMGRKNMKSTNALLAAFNARLGVWVPNPAHTTMKRMAAPRLVNMFKEIFGVYGDTDPNVYATDGGHWENLGLVELVRKECDFIIAIDTSGDVPGTYMAFKDAIALSYLECGAKIDIAESEWEALVPGEDTLVPRNYLRGTITYADPNKKPAELLYVKAAVSRQTPLAIQRYAAGDPTFPNYSTVNQMLSDAQLTNLFKLGFSAMQQALTTREKSEKIG